MKMKMLCTAVATAVVAFTSHAGFGAAVVDETTFSADGRVSLDEPVAPVADPQQEATFTADPVDADRVMVESPTAVSSIDYAFTNNDSTTRFDITGHASAVDSPRSSGAAAMSLTFETTEAAHYRFSASIGAMPNYFAATLDDVTIDAYPDPAGPGGLGGNFAMTDLPLTGELAPGEHTFTFLLEGAGYLGSDAWASDANATLDVVTTPEPTTAALLGLAALTTLRRRARRA